MKHRYHALPIALSAICALLSDCELRAAEVEYVSTEKNRELGQMIRFGVPKDGIPPKAERWNPDGASGAVKLQDLVTEGRKALVKLNCKDGEKREVLKIEVVQVRVGDEEIWVGIVYFRDHLFPKERPQADKVAAGYTGSTPSFMVMVPLDKTKIVASPK